MLYVQAYIGVNSIKVVAASIQEGFVISDYGTFYRDLVVSRVRCLTKAFRWPSVLSITRRADTPPGVFR